ncbi:hypothetical protein ACGFJ7_00590 [Actinoplanes sp. NPDC048988]|uniref:hypothetical protein n=1 Tax=Actinoplanes sp. NPDC048988 TaxID=3363901 RepID=UPI0037150247
MTMLWNDVFVSASVVASDGFTAELGGVVEMALQLYDGGGPGRVHELAGRVVEADRTMWPEGWMIDVDGVGIYVIGVPVPPPGGLVQARGRLGFAEDYLTGDFLLDLALVP